MSLFSLFKFKNLFGQKLLADKEEDSFFDKNGYVVTNFLTTTQTDELKELYQSMIHPFSDGFKATLHSQDKTYKRLVNEGILNIIGSDYSSLILNYRPFIANFLIKFPGKQGNLQIHQDFTFTDESKYTSLNIWIPLIDVDTNNGCISVLSGSHKWKSSVRASPSSPSFFDCKDEQLLHLPMKVGEALIHSHRLFHSSGENKSNVPRIAVCIGLIPVEAPLVHHFLHKDMMLDTFHVSDDFFKNFNIGDYPHGERLIKREKYFKSK
jgi:hypothetical protein